MTPTREVQERIRRYLLGQISDRAREEIERDLVANEEVFAELLIIEDELTDEYISDSLSPAERANFEGYFLATPERQEDLRFAQALNRYVTTTASGQADLPRLLVPGFLGSQTRLVRIAAAVAVLAIIAGALWFVWPRQPSPRTFATLTLSISPNTRDGGVQAPKTKLPLGKDALRIFLKLPNPPPPAVGYRVQLLDAHDESRSLGIAGQDTQTVVVEIPGAQLQRGQCLLNLFAIKADGTEQRINGSYYFTVE
jgi:hypothetical protein